MKIGEKIFPAEWVRGKGKEGKELSKGVIQDCGTTLFNPFISHPKYLGAEWCSSPRETHMVGWCVVGAPVRDIFADLSGNPQSSFLVAHCVCFFLHFLSSLPQGEVGESGLPGAHGLPGATGPKVTLKLRVIWGISQGQISGTQA